MRSSARDAAGAIDGACLCLESVGVGALAHRVLLLQPCFQALANAGPSLGDYVDDGAGLDLPPKPRHSARNVKRPVEGQEALPFPWGAVEHNLTTNRKQAFDQPG